MAFLSRIGLIETEERERARLAQAPEGSISHYLSTLPITIKEWPQDLLVRLPWNPPRADKKYAVVVVPIEYRRDLLPEDVDEEALPRRLNPGSWTCAVVFSNHPSYPVGGHRIIVGADEIARGTKVLIEDPSPPRHRLLLMPRRARPKHPTREPEAGMPTLHLYAGGIVGSPGIPMATFAATPVADLMRYHRYGHPEATLSGVVCGHCSGVFGDLVVRHASAGHVRACFEAGQEERAQMEADLAAERAVERHFEDSGYWEARAQEDYEMSRGIWSYQPPPIDGETAMKTPCNWCQTTTAELSKTPKDYRYE